MLKKKFMNLFEIVKKNSIKFPEKDALVIGELKLSYRDFLEKIIKTIRVFQKNKINSKSTVALIDDNTLTNILSIFALAYLGSRIIPLSSQYSYNWIFERFKNVKVEVLISNSKTAEYLKKKINFKKIISIDKSKNFNYFYDYSNINDKKLKTSSRNLDNDFLVVLSSGSTGNPKPIVFSQKTKYLRSKFMQKLYKIKQSDKVTLTCPIEHSLGMRLLFLPFVSGATCIVMPKFTPVSYFKIVKKFKATFSILVSNQIYQLLEQKNSFNHFYLKTGLVSASSILTDEAKKKIIDKKIKLYEMYGASEIATATSININKERGRIKSVGKSYNSKIKIRILSEKNKFLKMGEIGEIVCKTPLKFKYYLNKKKTTKISYFKNYFKTGDIGYLDKQSYLFFLGRKKNIIRRSGFSVYPEDIENIFLNDRNISEVAVIGVNRVKNEEIHLFLKKEKKLNDAYIKNICIKKLSTFQMPNKIHFLDKLPKTNLGKVDKKILLSFAN